MTKIKYSDIKYYLEFTAHLSYPKKAKIVFIRNEDMSVSEHQDYKIKEQFREELKQYLYNCFDKANLCGQNFDLQPIAHWNTKK